MNITAGLSAKWGYEMAMRFSRPALAMTLASAFCVSNASAAVSGPDEQPEAAGASMEGVAEIIVTAQRKSESLERTPVSVAVLGGDALARQAIVSESDLQSQVPGLTVKASASSNQLNYSIRGQSLDAFSGVRPGVLPYFNEVYLGHCSPPSFIALRVYDR